MAKLIFTCEYIPKGRAGGYVKYIATRDGVVIPRLENHMGYIANRPNSHGLFTSSDDPIQLTKIAKEVDNHHGNVWTNVISLRREDAVRLGYDNPESWRTLLRSHAQTFAEQMKVPLEDLRWYAAFHDEGHHPHCHMVAYSVGKQPYLSKAGIDGIRSALARDIFKQDLMQIYQKQTDYRNALTAESRLHIADIMRQIECGEFSNPMVEDLLTQLSERLANHKGKKVYGYLDQPSRQLVNSIVDELGKDERISTLYDLWCEQRENVLSKYRNSMPERIPLSQNSEFKSIKNEIIKQLIKPQLTIDNGKLTIKGQDIVGATDSVARYDDDMPLEEVDEFDPDEYFAEWSDEYKLARVYLYDNDQAEQDFDKAFTLMTAEAERGNALALFDVGRMYKDGLGCEQDIDTAQEWFTKAYSAFIVAEENIEKNAYIQYRLGKMHAQGLGVEQDYESAAGWYNCAAGQNNPSATYALGGLYYRGEGVAQSYQEAFELYTASATHRKAPNVYAMYELGKMCRDGIGTKSNADRAFIWFASAFGGFERLEKEINDDKLQYRLGQMCMNGVGTNVDLQQAHDYFEKSAKMDNINAIYGLGTLYLDEKFTGHNSTKAVEWLEKACDENHIWAQFRLGVILLYGKGVAQDMERGLELLSASAEQGNEIAQAVIESYHAFQERIKSFAKVNAQRHATIASLNLFRNLARLIQSRLDVKHQDGNVIVDDKLRREIAEKKRGLGLRG